MVKSKMDAFRDFVSERLAFTREEAEAATGSNRISSMVCTLRKEGWDIKYIREQGLYCIEDNAREQIDEAIKSLEEMFNKEDKKIEKTYAFREFVLILGTITLGVSLSFLVYQLVIFFT